MKPLTSRGPLLFTSYSSSPLHFFNHRSKFLRVFNLSTYLPQNPSHSRSSRRHDEESRNVRVSVWWDFENCNIPAGTNVFKVSQSIAAAIRANGIKGPIQITAFGDVLQLSRSNQEALSSTGIILTHIPQGGKNSADRSLLVDLMYWVSQNPPPAHIFLISGDRDFACILHRLRMNNYNILLASLDAAPSVLCSAASIMWHWYALVRGENITGKHFNQHPDGPYNSWYGQYKVHLEDPFSAPPEQPASPRVESSETKTDSKPCPFPKDCSDSGSDLKIRPVPKAVTEQISHILSSFPKGMAIGNLRSELGKSNINLDKDLYGYKKFSRFLLSMPHILKVQFGNDRRYLVRGLNPRVPEPVLSIPDLVTGAVTNNGMQDSSVTRKLNVPSSSNFKTVDGNSESPSQSHELNVVGPPTRSDKPSPLSKVVADVPNALSPEGHPLTVEEQDSASDVGFFQKILRKWFVHEDNNCERTHSVPAKSSAPVDRSKSEEKCENSTSPSPNPVLSVPCASASDGFIQDNKSIRSSEELGDKSRATPVLLNQIIKWCKFWSSTAASENLSGHSNKKLSQLNHCPMKHELFPKESFWDDIEAFLDTSKGARIVSLSRSREQMAEALLKEGPVLLRSLRESDILCLVEMLISEKKWLEECSSQTSPFKLTLPVRISSSGSHASRGLRSIFSAKLPESDLPKTAEPNKLKKNEDAPHNSAPSVISKKCSNRSRDEILSDCQRLVADMLKEHPEGFNMGIFRRRFRERYNYFLDTHILGYPKLASLLQTMPGVRIESNYVFSDINIPNNAILENCASGKTTNPDSELSDTSRNDDDLESPWYELGPVENSNSNRAETVSGRKAKEETVGHNRNQFDHEYSLSDDDDDLSDLEEGSSPAVSGGQRRPKINNEEEDSSLLQILDSWYCNKEDGNRNDCSENGNGVVNCSKNGSKTSGSSGVGLKTETTIMSYGRKEKPSRSYSFVSDQVGDNKEKLVDGILGSLKKSGEYKMGG